MLSTDMSLPAECWHWSLRAPISTTSREWSALVASPPIECPLDPVKYEGSCTYEVTWKFTVQAFTMVRLRVGDVIVGEGAGPALYSADPSLIAGRRVMPLHGRKIIRVEMCCHGGGGKHATMDWIEVDVKRSPLSAVE